MPIKTLSIPQEMEDFLNENPDLSPSKLLQSKIIEIQESRKLNFMEITRMRRAIRTLTESLATANGRIYDLETENAKLIQQKD